MHPDYSGSDLVALRPFMDYIEDPSLLKALMEEQGVTGVDYVEPTDPMTGGTADNNYKGYIHWTDGTQTKVQIKGSRSEERKPAAFREPLFYSRIADSVSEAGVSVPPHYLAVADSKQGKGLYISEFMVDYLPLKDIYDKVTT